jgi:hypothetical protein
VFHNLKGSTLFIETITDQLKEKHNPSIILSIEKIFTSLIPLNARGVKPIEPCKEAIILLAVAFDKLQSKRQM